jgi:hypothetical protein
VKERQIDLGLSLKAEALQLFVVDSGDELQKAPGSVEVDVDDLAEVVQVGMHEGAHKAAGMEMEAADRPTKRGPDAPGIKSENSELGEIGDGRESSFHGRLGGSFYEKFLWGVREDRSRVDRDD